MTRIMKTSLLLLSVVCALVFPAAAYSVNFYDGARAKQGLYVLTYSSLYDADRFADAKAKTVDNDRDYRKYEELFRVCYYSPHHVFTAFLPFGKVYSHDASSSGVGDINLGAGSFLPIRRVDILPMLFVKFPSGEYASEKAVNYGTNQYDIKPALFIYKQAGLFSLDAAAKYYFRMENRSTDTRAGNELHLQMLCGLQATKTCKAGPSIAWMRSAKKRIRGSAVADSEREVFSAGADIYYRFPAISVTFTYLNDFRAKNSTRGHFFQLKTCRKF